MAGVVPKKAPVPEAKIDSLDAKIVQYHYAILQLQVYIPQIKRFQETVASDPSRLPLMPYIVLAIQQLFLISEGPFNARLKLLREYALFKPLSVSVPATVSHVPYDIQDLPVEPLSSIPSSSQSLKCLKLLELLCQNCLHAYLGRLQLAKVAKLEQRRLQDPELKMEAIDSQMDELAKFLEEKLFTSDCMLDLNDMVFALPPDHESLATDSNYVEATLIDFDIKMLYYISKLKTIVEDKLKVEITRLRTMRTMQQAAQTKFLRQLPHSHLLMHLILAMTLKLNEAYNVTRRFARQIYLPNAQHLYDLKLITQIKNPMYFKLHILKDFEELANANKKNGTLIATITRFIRANSEFTVNPKNVLDITNTLSLANGMIITCLTTIEDFRVYWIHGEVKFRKLYSIPRKNLALIHQEFNPKPKTEVKASNTSEETITPNKAKSTSTTADQQDNNSITSKDSLDSLTITKSDKPPILTINSDISSLESLDSSLGKSPTTSESISASSAIIAELFNDDHIQSIESDFKALDIKNQAKLTTPSTTGTRSRSSSQSSVTSIGSGSNRRRSVYGSLTSPTRQLSNASTSSTRGGLYSQNNGSLTNFPLTTLANDSSSSPAPPALGGRRRANSQPIRPSSMYISSSSPLAPLSPPITQPKSHAASGAAAALVRNMNKQDGSKSNAAFSAAAATATAIVRSPNGMVRRSPSLTKKAQAGTSAASLVSPLAHKVQPFTKPVRPKVVKEEEDTSDQKPAVHRMTANQRLQQHLKNASQQGALVTQQKEQLRSVTVDVSELSHLKMKRYTEVSLPPPPPEPVPPVASASTNNSISNAAAANSLRNRETSPPSATTTPGKITRQQMTRINTKKNTGSQYMEESSSTSSNSSMSAVNSSVETASANSSLTPEDGGAVVKRVRFIGVPQYSEAEDAPTNYAQKILKNFAMLRPGKPVQRLSFAQKEHLLKKEESLSFRKQLHSNAQ